MRKVKIREWRTREYVVEVPDDVTDRDVLCWANEQDTDDLFSSRGSVFALGSDPDHNELIPDELQEDDNVDLELAWDDGYLEVVDE